MNLITIVYTWKQLQLLDNYIDSSRVTNSLIDLGSPTSDFLLIRTVSNMIQCLKLVLKHAPAVEAYSILNPSCGGSRWIYSGYFC